MAKNQKILSNESIETDILNCERCGKNHKKLTCWKFPELVHMGNEDYNYFSFCPETHYLLVLKLNIES